MHKLNLNTIKKNLSCFDKIIVTGPPRSGTTISSMIIADILKYKFVDESFYDANNPKKFLVMLHLPRKMVIQMTAFLKSIVKEDIASFLNNNKIAVVLIRRNITDILKSFKNTENFDMSIKTSSGLFTKIGEEEQRFMFEHYGFSNKSDPIPLQIYQYFYDRMSILENVFSLRYEKLSSHKFFVKEGDRRKHFKHIKQVKVDDPYYLQNQIMVL